MKHKLQEEEQKVTRPGQRVIKVFMIKRALKFTRFKPAILLDDASVNILKRFFTTLLYNQMEQQMV